jgi:hypothetical protein
MEVDLLLGGFSNVEQRQRRRLLVFRFVVGRLYCIERKGESVLTGGGVKGGGLLGARFIERAQPRLRPPREQVAQHRCELELGEERAAGFEVGRLGFHRR